RLSFLEFRNGAVIAPFPVVWLVRERPKQNSSFDFSPAAESLSSGSTRGQASSEQSETRAG
ncbi:MAG: hypothetical protein ACXW3M_04825, partial [Rhodoplanes sp.]